MSILSGVAVDGEGVGRGDSVGASESREDEVMFGRISSVLSVLACVAGMTHAAAGDLTGRIGIHNNSSAGNGAFGQGGLHVSGSHRGSRWSFDYNIGSDWGHGWNHSSGSNSWHWSGGHLRPIRNWNGYYSPDYYRPYVPYGYATGQIVAVGNGPTDWSLLPGVAPPASAAAAATPPPPPPTIMEQAVDAMSRKHLVEAKGFFIEHLKTNPDDTEASRRLAMCLIEGKEIDTGLAMLRDMYMIDPTLAERPYDGPAAGQNLNRLREIVTKITPYAHKVKSPSAWLGVVIAMQAEGRNAPALKILARAKDAGLERSVVDRFAAVLSPPPPATAKKPPLKTVAPAPAAPAAAQNPATPPVPGPTAEPAAPKDPPSVPEKKPESVK